MEHFKARVQLNEDGSYRNPVKLDGLETADPKLIGKQLNHIAATARTGGELQPIGSLYGFDLLVKSETTEKDGFDLTQNRFYARGEADYLYSYNHGNIAEDLTAVPREDLLVRLGFRSYSFSSRMTNSFINRLSLYRNNWNLIPTEK